MQNNIMMTSGYNFEGYTIKQYLGVCSGECAMGTGFLSSLGAGLADLFGSNSMLYSSKMRNAKAAAINLLQKEAAKMGANAIIGVDIDYTTYSSDIMGVAANGTAVVVEEIRSTPRPTTPTGLVLSFPIQSYNTDFPFTPLSIHFAHRNGSTEAWMEYVTRTASVAALSISITPIDVFEVPGESNSLTFVSTAPTDAGSEITERIPTTTTWDAIRTAKEVNVTIEKALCNDIVISRNTEDLPITLAEKDLVTLRKLLGPDAVCNPSRSDCGWICACGKENTDEKRICDRCARAIDSLSFGNDIESQIIFIRKEIETMKNAAEISVFLNDHAAAHPNTIPSELLTQLHQIVQAERIYGNVKSEAIKAVHNAFPAS